MLKDNYLKSTTQSNIILLEFLTNHIQSIAIKIIINHDQIMQKNHEHCISDNWPMEEQIQLNIKYLPIKTFKTRRSKNNTTTPIKYT
jgi:hypothetical protein